MQSGSLKREDEAWKSQHRGAAAAAKVAEGRRSQSKVEKEEEMEEEVERRRRREEKEEEERLVREERESTRQLASEQVLASFSICFLKALCLIDYTAMYYTCNRIVIMKSLNSLFIIPLFRRAPGKSYLKQLLEDKRKKY